MQSGRDGIGCDIPAPWRTLIQNGDIQIAIDNQGKRTGDRCGGHDIQVWIDALLSQRHPLRHAKAVLLIRDYQAEILKVNILTNQGVGANGDLAHAAFQTFAGFPPILGPQGTGYQFHADIRPAQQVGKSAVMLFGEDLGGGHHSALHP